MASKQVTIELLADRSIRGQPEKKGSKHTISEGVANDLISRNFAKPATSPKH